MKKIVIFQVLTVVVATICLLLTGATQEAKSLAAGGFLVTLNFVMLASGWKLIFGKKLIALSVLIIVFKYAILGIIIYVIVRQSWLMPLWFAAGVTSLMVGSLIYGLTLGHFEKEEDENEE